jgi:hypothetical protein
VTVEICPGVVIVVVSLACVMEDDVDVVSETTAEIVEGNKTKFVY